MQTKDQLGGIKERILIHRALGISVGAFAVFLLGFAIIPVIIASASATNQVAGSINWGVVTLTLDPDYGNGSIGDEGHGDVLFNDITPSANNIASGGSNYGTLKILKKTIGITSASGKYYTVFISTEGENNNLNLQLTGSEVDSQVNIPAISTNSASFANPQTFSGSGWGFAIPGTTISVNNVTPTYITPAATVLGEQITANTSDTDIAGASTAYAAVWSPVPVASAAQQIWKASTNNQYGFGTWKENEGTPDEVTIPGDTVNNHFDIYYAIAADTDQLAGTYANKVVYTALASASQLDQVSTNMIRDVAFGGEGDVQTLKFDLVESLPFLEESDIKIVVVPHSTIAAADYDVSALSQSNFAECPVVANSLDSTSGTYTSVQCTMPSLTSIQAKSGSSSSDVEDGTGIGSFDYWLNVSGYNYNYLSLAKDANSNNVASFVYAGLQSKYYDAYSAADALAINYARNGEYVVQDMQQMRGVICDQTNRWNRKWGNMAKVYTYDATNSDFSWEAGALNIDSDSDGTPDTWDPSYHTGKSDKLFYDTTSTLTDAQYGAQFGIGSFALKDTRDGKRYVVRRMADGNCWMAQNLDLDLYTGMTLSAEDTDISTDWTISDYTEDGELGTQYSGVNSEYWHSMHGVETVTLYKGIYNSSTGEWDETVVESCTEGTQQSPCLTLAEEYIKFYSFDSSGNPVPETIDGYNNPTSGVYAKHTYNVKRVSFNSSAQRHVLTDATPDSCTMYVSISGVLYDEDSRFGYCRVETTGPSMILQHKYVENNALVGVPRIASTSTGLTITSNHAVNQNRFLDGRASALSRNEGVTSAADYRWQRYDVDGVHVYDIGVRPFGRTNNRESGAYESSAFNIYFTDYVSCNEVGTASGTLALDGETLTSEVCLDSEGRPDANADYPGNLYNAYAATAGKITYNITTEISDRSICPKGWQLPTATTVSGVDKSFQNLLTDVSDDPDSSPVGRIISVPLSLTTTGRYGLDGSRLKYAYHHVDTQTGYLWSGRRVGNDVMGTNSAYFTQTSTKQEYIVYNSDSTFGPWGFGIRCVARD